MADRRHQRGYLQEHLPHLGMMLRGRLDGALACAEAVVVTKVVEGLDLTGKTVVDLTGNGLDHEQTNRSPRREAA